MSLLKESKAFIWIGVIFVITIFICNYNRKDIYEKKIHYGSPDQIIDVFNNNQLSVNDMGNVCSTKEYLECISKRKRACNDVFDVESIHLTYDKDYNTRERIQSFYKHYVNMKKKYKESYSDVKVKFYSTTLNSQDNIEVGIVFIDEGEGYVMDYYEFFSIDDDEYAEGNGEY